MLDTEKFLETLIRNNIKFYSGIPDSLLKNICAAITDRFSEREHVITANEGSAIALAAGFYLATQEIPLVYMQNSGLGNTINPLTSLAAPEVYGIPMLLMIGWRGEPGVKDEPQHVKKGKITIPLLDTMGIPYFILPREDKEAALIIRKAIELAKSENTPVALLIKKDLFSKYSLRTNKEDISTLGREEAIEIILKNTSAKNSVYFGNTGMIGRELYETRKRIGGDPKSDFLNVGSMGHTSQIALGVSLNTNKTVYCIDGDGSLIMHLGGITTIGNLAKDNFIHIILNNSAHDSVGGQPTIADKIDFNAISLASGYKSYSRIKNKEDLEKELSKKLVGPVMIEVLVKKGNRPDIGRPKESPSENKKMFMKNLNS